LAERVAKPLTFAGHALDAIEEREIDVAWVLRTIDEPDWTEDDPKPGRTRYSGRSRNLAAASCAWSVLNIHVNGVSLPSSSIATRESRDDTDPHPL
jgi:hypothetical protein